MDAKHELVVRHKKPIAAAKEPPYGLFIPATSEEKQRYIASLQATLRETYQLLKNFSAINVEELIKQGVLW